MNSSNDFKTILSLESLECHALLKSREDRKKAFTSYLAFREKIARDFLHLIASKEPFMNDHSREHLQRVLYHIESILECNYFRKNSKIVDIPTDRILSWADTMILLNALIWHDIGNIYGRKGHAKKVRNCLEAIAPYLYDTHLKNYIIQVAEAHSGENAIENSIPDSHAASHYENNDIHLQFIAAVLRFADEIDEDHRRAKPNEYEDLDLIPEESQRFWFFSKSNSSIKVSNEIGMMNFDFWVNIESYIPKSKFDRKFKADGSNIEAATEYFRRILKFEKERRYCNKYITKFYHPGIKGFRVNLKTNEPDEQITSKNSYKFLVHDDLSLKDYLNKPEFKDLHVFIDKALKNGGYNA